MTKDSAPLPTKTLRLTVEVPDWWADHLDEHLRIWTGDEEASPDDLLELVVEEEMDRDAVLVVKAISNGEDPDQMVSLRAYIVGAEVRDGR